MAFDRLLVALCLPLALSCGGEQSAEDDTGVGPIGSVGGETDDPTGTDDGGTFTVIGSAADGLSAPRDLAFSPGAPNQLWTFNTPIHGTVIFFDPGTDRARPPCFSAASLSGRAASCGMPTPRRTRSCASTPDPTELVRGSTRGTPAPLGLDRLAEAEQWLGEHGR